MNKEETKDKLRKAESNLRQANVVLEMDKQWVKDIQEEIAKLEAIINKPDRWQDSLVQPEKEEYFYLKSSPSKGLAVGIDSEVYRKPEHSFKTAEQAKLIKEKALLMQEMYSFAYVRNEGWMPDWNDSSQKYGIILSGNKAYVEYSIYMNKLAFGVAVKSMVIAEEMLEIFGERIEKFYNKMY